MHKLWQITQEKNESVEKYATVVQALQNRILLAYDADKRLSGREIINKELRLEDEITKQFINGLLPHLDYKVTALRPKNLADAIQYTKTTEDDYASKVYERHRTTSIHYTQATEQQNTNESTQEKLINEQTKALHKQAGQKHDIRKITKAKN